MTTEKYLSIKSKLELIKFAAANPKKSQEELVAWVQKEFGPTLNRSTISKILKCKDKITNNANGLSVTRARYRAITFQEVDVELFDWVTCNQGCMPITETVLIEQATYIARKIKAIRETEHMTRGWILSFRKRHAIRQRAVCGEAAAVDKSVINIALPQLQQRISEFEPQDVFNYDESCLFYRLEPNKTLATKPISGRKKDLERITIGLCTNALGTEKLNPIVIGKYRKPRCFKNISNINNLQIVYRHNKTAWMTGTIFKEWIINVDNQISINTPDRKILMIMDNATCHVIPEIDLKSIEILFLPPKSTAVLQPLDAGIIASFKTKYRSIFVRNLLEERRKSNIPLDKLNILQAIKFITRSWDEITSTIIQNCWVHTRLISQEALGLVPVLCNESINESQQLQELINNFTGENQLDADAYLNIEATTMPDEDYSMTSMSGDEIEVDSLLNHDTKKQEVPPISCSEALTATQLLIQFLQQQPEDQSKRIKEVIVLEKEIELKKLKKKHQKCILDFFNKN